MRVCYPQEMRSLDRIATDKYKIPGIVLMENAAIACVREIEKRYGNIEGLEVTVFCGKGNNGGDGFAIARHLFNKGAKVGIILTSGEPQDGDARINYDICKELGIDIYQSGEEICDLMGNNLIVDAIFGTGFKGEVKGQEARFINLINRTGQTVVSVDVPSGINADTGKVASVCVKADITVTFAAYKTGLLMYPGADYAGEIVVKDISIPQEAFEEIDSDISVTDKKLFLDNMPKREKNSHKGDYGKLLVIAGSKGMTGAAYLSAQSAMVAGSGLVTLAVPECINDILEVKTTEVMTMPLACRDGHVSRDAIAEIESKLYKIDAVLIGPGLGISEDVKDILKMLLEKSQVPLIIDADAINCLAEIKENLKNKKCEVILTPHTVEFSRISGLSAEQIENDRLCTSRDFAKEYSVTLILKGSRTIVTASDETQYINMTGNPSLATGGSGDVLAGIVASFAARGIAPDKVAAMATFLHGMCGDIASGMLGEESVIASSILECIPRAYNQILQVEK